MMKEMQVRNKKCKSFYLFCVLSLYLLASCTHKEDIYYRFHEISGSKWAIGDTLCFDVDSTLFELGVPYNVMLEVTNNIEYPYRNIWFSIYDDLDGNKTTSAEYYLADKEGKWVGSGFGALYQNSFSYKKNVIFRERKDYHIKVVHGMSDDVLRGIERFGIHIRKKSQ